MSATKDEPGAEKITLEIKLPQLLAGVVASLATAVLGSRLGVNGTLLGAAFSSLGIGLLSPFVTFGLLRTHQGLRTRTGRLVADPADAAAPAEQPSLLPLDAPAPAAQPALLPLDAAAPAAQPAPAEPDEGMEPDEVETLPRAEVRRRLGPRAVLLGVLATALVTFALTLGVLTLVEASAGRSVDGAHGTTLQGVTRPQAAASTTTPAPTPSATHATSASPTATATATASSASPLPTPTATVTTPAPTTPALQPTSTTTSAATPTQPVVSATPANATLRAAPTATPSA